MSGLRRTSAPVQTGHAPGGARMAHAHDFAETVILITDDGMGRSDAALRHKLIRTYLQLLLESPTLPGVLCFYSEGVKLVVQDSPVLEVLGQLEQKGVILISCATCLNFYSLAEKVQVGVIGGMHEILAAQAEAAKVITL